MAYRVDNQDKLPLEEHILGLPILFALSRIVMAIFRVVLTPKSKKFKLNDLEERKLIIIIVCFVFIEFDRAESGTFL